MEENFERDISVTVTQFILSPDIPQAEKQYFEKFYMLFSKIMALSNIHRWDMIGLLAGFDEVCLLMEMRLYQEARKLMGRILMEMQCARSFDGFYTLYGQQGVNRIENIQRTYQNTLDQTKKKGLLGIFRKKPEQKEQIGMERNE